MAWSCLLFLNETSTMNEVELFDNEEAVTPSQMNEVELFDREEAVATISKLKPAFSYTSNSLHDAVKLRLGESDSSTTPPQTLPQLFAKACRDYASCPAIAFATPGSDDYNWTTLTYAEFKHKVHQAALILLHVGLEPRSSVGILSFNCPEWFIAELGTFTAGGILAGIYPSNSVEAVHHVLDTSDATVCLVDDAQQMAKVHSIKSRLPRLKAVIQIHGPFEPYVSSEPGYYRWSDLEKLQFDATLEAELQERERSVCANECAMLIFTSGTVGMPKGVMISHDSVVFNAKTIAATFTDVQVGCERIVTYLPLSHIAAQLFDIFAVVDCGGCIYFADRYALKGTLTRTLQRARPTRFFGVPRVYEKLQEQYLAGEATKSFSRLLFNKARDTVSKYHLMRIEGKEPTFYCNMKYWIASKVIHSVKFALGLDNCKTFLIGAAPVAEQLKHYFLSLDMPLVDAYGLSESGGAIVMNRQFTSLSSNGTALDGFEIKIREPDTKGEGEICVRGRSLCMGYLKEPTKTREILTEDGWLLTGDVGYLDALGNLFLTGRLKELIITSGGENIPPVHIEELIISELPCVSNALLVGEHRKYLTVLLALKTETDPNTGLPLDNLRPEFVEWLESLDLHYTHLSQLLNIPVDQVERVMKGEDPSGVEINAEPKLWQAIEEGIARANRHSISNAQKVQKFALLPHDFSIPTGELGPTLKIRRKIVLQKYAGIIDRLYK